MRQRGGSEQPVKGRRTNKPKARTLAAPSIADLQKQLGALTRELKEARQQQTATADVLKVMNRSAFDLQPVLEALIETAARLCKAESAGLSIREGEVYRYVATFAHEEEYSTLLKQLTFAPGRGTVAGRTALEGKAVHVADLAADPEYTGPTISLTIAKTRTALGVPLLRDGVVMGTLTLMRRRVEPFSERQIELVQSFADQAVIAIENARLLTEQHEALERQTATAEILQVINSSPGDLAAVFDVMLQKALSLCGAAFGQLVTFDGVGFRAAAWRGYEPGPGASAPLPGMALYQLVHGEQIVHIPDITADDVYRSGNPIRRRLADEYGGRTAIWVALRKDEKLLGAIVIFRTEVRPFSDKQIALLQGFAGQAVIAIENARLLNETKEALERQTATAEVLQVINSSPGDLVPVFDAMLEKALRLCEATFGALFIRDGEQFHAAATRDLPAALDTFVRTPFVPPPESTFRQALRGEAVVHIADIAAHPDPANPQRGRLIEAGGGRTLLQVALYKDAELLGAFSIFRQEVRPFSDKQIALLENFAAQAVIAMENARLITETREALEQQTATADVLKVISRSSVDLETVLETLVETAARLCRADQAFMFRRLGDMYYRVASHGLSREEKEFFSTHPFAPNRGTITGRAVLERRAVHIPDVLQDPEYTFWEAQKLSGFRTSLGVPLLRGEALLGIFAINRTRVEPSRSRMPGCSRSCATDRPSCASPSTTWAMAL